MQMLRKLDLLTPALVVDLDVLEANILSMQSSVAAAGKQLRPHAKAHKRTAIAKRQVEAGAAGVCCATLNEMEAMIEAGISVLLTTPIAQPAKAGRIASLALKGDVTVVADHPQQAAWYAESAEAAGTKLRVLVDLDIGDHRTGIPCDERAIRLAQTIEESKHLKFRGLQAYSVSGSHTVGHVERTSHSRNCIAKAVAIQNELLARGLNSTRLTGGSTGTWDIDICIPEFTELQAGSYPLMDVAYGRIGGVPFDVAMTVLATVISTSHADRVTVDAGFKAFATDRPFGPVPLGEGSTGWTWHWAGDEHGILSGERLPSLGETVAFVAPHCDPTVNLHANMYACRGDHVEEVWTR